jgi:hypothetical protein
VLAGWALAGLASAEQDLSSILAGLVIVAVIACTSGTYVRENFHDQLPLGECIRVVSERALDEFQDFVDEKSAEPWPGARTVPRAHAEVRGAWVHLWYGPADAPALECEPIEIA